jgi:hypothetical protein
MAFTAQSAADLIVAEVESSAPKAELKAASIVPGNFCSIWKQAKPVLQFIAGIVAFIPGLGKTAAAVLAGLIKVGDQIAETLNCS